MVYVAQPTAGWSACVETRVIPPPKESKALPQIVILPPKKDAGISGVAFEAPLTVEVIDPDAAKDSRSVALVTLTTTDGATVEVECHVSAQFSDLAGDAAAKQALEEGRFVGQVILQLGGKSSPAIVPLTTDMPRNLLGKVRLGDEAGVDNTGANLVTRVLNLTGKDVVTADLYRRAASRQQAGQAVGSGAADQQRFARGDRPRLRERGDAAARRRADVTCG